MPLLAIEETMDAEEEDEAVCAIPENLYLYPDFVAEEDAHVTHDENDWPLSRLPVFSKITMLVEIAK